MCKARAKASVKALKKIKQNVEIKKSTDINEIEWRKEKYSYEKGEQHLGVVLCYTAATVPSSGYHWVIPSQYSKGYFPWLEVPLLSPHFFCLHIFWAFAQVFMGWGPTGTGLTTSSQRAVLGRSARRKRSVQMTPNFADMYRRARRTHTAILDRIWCFMPPTHSDFDSG